VNSILLPLITQETGNPAHSLDVITVDEVKQHLRITGSSENDLIQSYIYAAVETLESYLGMNFLNGTYTSNFDYCSCICGYEIRQRPFQSVSKIEYWDGTEYIEMSSDEYIVQIQKFKTIIQLHDFNSTVEREKDYPVLVEFLSGFGATSADVPENIKLALKLMVGKIYNERGDCGPDCPNGLCIAKPLVRSYKGLRFGEPRSDRCGCLC
jgi:uncharacterized phiE125 gp8 family phage protein